VTRSDSATTTGVSDASAVGVPAAGDSAASIDKTIVNILTSDERAESRPFAPSVEVSTPDLSPLGTCQVPGSKGPGSESRLHVHEDDLRERIVDALLRRALVRGREGDQVGLEVVRGTTPDRFQPA